MNRYDEMKHRQQAEFDKFPLGATFSDEQFEKMMAGWGLTVNDTDKIYSIGGGCFIRKSDSAALDEMTTRFDAEKKKAISEDATGLGFIKDMFASELANHEYGYTYELDETLDALGLTLDEVKADKRLRAGLNAALKKYYDHKYEI